MRFPTLPFYFTALCAVLFFIGMAPQAIGDLAWSEDGWEVEDNALAGMSRDDAQAALDLMNEARYAQDKGRDRTALRAYRRIARRYRESVFAPQALFEKSEIRRDRRQWTKAFDNLQEIVRLYPDYPHFDSVIRNQFEIATAIYEGERLRLFWTIPGFRSRERAVLYNEFVLFNAPFSEYAPQALMNIARSYEHLGREFEAIHAYDRLISNYPRSEKAPEAYLGIARAHASMVAGPDYDQGATEEAISYYEDFLILFPDHYSVAEAEEGLEEMREILSASKLIVGDFYFRRRSNYRAARVFYNEAITVAPESFTADRARERILEIDRREGAQESAN